MKVTRAASIPLVTHDPYFSIWSGADHLYDKDPVHWSQIRQQLRGYVNVDGVVYSFLGDKEFHETIGQTGVDVTATSTTYTFENEKIILNVKFTSPLLLDDLTLVSRPCTYIDYAVEKKENCDVRVDFVVASDLVSQKQAKLIGCNARRPEKDDAPAYNYAQMGRAAQKPLGGSGDHVTIDWGYVYVASAEKGAVCTYDAANEKLICRLPLDDDKAGMILAYDDLLSINYFGQWRKAYWTNTYATILDAIGAAFADHDETLKHAAAVDEKIEKEAYAAGGEKYAFLCNMSYRHAIAAHKLITDEDGNIIFLSKENDSNGCIGTVDVSYPSVPLFLLFNTEYVKGMLRPVFQFAACDSWEFDFAPHDVGRYPYAWGQVYGLNGKKGDLWFSGWNDDIFPPFYQYPAGTDIFEFRYQMPVEECGNMLLMTAAVCKLDGNALFAEPHMAVLKQWTQYLVKFGADPGEQLCTDDFAGHLSHNVNLSAKAIMGIEAYARLAAQLGRTEEAEEYHAKAAEMAKDWEKRAIADDHYVLAFGNADTWSLKYNLVWDKFFGSKLFSDEVYEKELKYYVKKTNEYGTPLDSRKDYTKSDWILWCASMAKTDEEALALIAPVAHYLETTTTRVPFSDWYETVTGECRQFMGRSVQGGIFMPVLMKKFGQ